MKATACAPKTPPMDWRLELSHDEMARLVRFVYHYDLNGSVAPGLQDAVPEFEWPLLLARGEILWQEEA